MTNPGKLRMNARLMRSWDWPNWLLASVLNGYRIAQSRCQRGCYQNFTDYFIYGVQNHWLTCWELSWRYGTKCRRSVLVFDIMLELWFIRPGNFNIPGKQYMFNECTNIKIGYIDDKMYTSVYVWVPLCAHLGNGTGHRTATMTELLLLTSGTSEVWSSAS